jgi:hypothetical protein
MKTKVTPKLWVILMLIGQVHQQIEGPLTGVVSSLEEI